MSMHTHACMHTPTMQHSYKYYHPVQFDCASDNITHPTGPHVCIYFYFLNPVESLSPVLFLASAKDKFIVRLAFLFIIYRLFISLTHYHFYWKSPRFCLSPLSGSILHLFANFRTSDFVTFSKNVIIIWFIFVYWTGISTSSYSPLLCAGILFACLSTQKIFEFFTLAQKNPGQDGVFSPSDGIAFWC